MAYGHAERTLAAIRILEAETTDLLASQDHLDTEQAQWLHDQSLRGDFPSQDFPRSWLPSPRQSDLRPATAALGPVLDGSALLSQPGGRGEGFVLGAVLIFLLHPLPGLLERHAQRGTTHAYSSTEILSRPADKTPARSPAGPPSGGPQPPSDPVSKSELRVLRYLPTHLSAPEIARELSLPVTTVRTHMRHLYAKLGAHSRTEAVDRARAGGLLAPVGQR